MLSESLLRKALADAAILDADIPRNEKAEHLIIKIIHTYVDEITKTKSIDPLSTFAACQVIGEFLAKNPKDSLTCWAPHSELAISSLTNLRAHSLTDDFKLADSLVTLAKKLI